MRQDTLTTHPGAPVADPSALPAASATGSDSLAHTPSRPLTPYQVLRMLPRDATPAQQDSAIQAWFQPDEIHYSSQPDTLHLPGHGPGRNPKEVNLPQYYRETFFSTDTLFHPEITGGRYGVAGDPVPYTIRGDDMFTSLLLFCFIIFVVSLAHSQHFIVRQFKSIFYFPQTETPVSETTSELRFQFFLVLLNCLLMGIATYIYITHYITDTFSIDSDIIIVGIFVAAFAGFFLLRCLIYSIVNAIFFNGKKTLQWNKTLLFVTALEGVLLFPAVLMQVYFDLALQNVAYYFIFVLIFAKLLTFYKCWVIFFRQNGFFLQIFLYFCALEIIPLLVFASAMVRIVDQLKINF